MKYALIGCGRIATNHIKAALANGFEIIAVCDIVPEQMDRLLAKFSLENSGIRRYTDYKIMIEETSPELISIATDSGVHAEIALFCLAQGIDTIIEKPIAMSIEDADRIVALAEEKGLKVAVCHQNRFNNAVQAVRQALDEGRFGRLSHGSVNVRWNRNEDYYRQAEWRGKWASDGGTLMNQCIHGIDLLRWLMGGNVVEVYGVTRRRFHDYLEAEDVGLAVITFADGSVATIEGTVNVYPRNLEETLYIFGETGTAKLGGQATNNIEVWNFADELDGDVEKRTLKEVSANVYGNGHISLFADMADSIANNRSPYVSAKDGRDALEIVLAIYKSQKTGLPVTLPLTNFASTDMEGEF